MSSTKSEALRVHSLKSEMLELHRRFSENVINKRAFAQRLHAPSDTTHPPASTEIPADFTGGVFKRYNRSPEIELKIV